jgi:hypothetical protein
VAEAYKSGGVICPDKKLAKKMRGVAGELIK